MFSEAAAVDSDEAEELSEALEVWVFSEADVVALSAAPVASVAPCVPEVEPVLTDVELSVLPAVTVVEAVGSVTAVVEATVPVSTFVVVVEAFVVVDFLVVVVLFFVVVRFLVVVLLFVVVLRVVVSVSVVVSEVSLSLVDSNTHVVIGWVVSG